MRPKRLWSIGLFLIVSLCCGCVGGYLRLFGCAAPPEDPNVEVMISECWSPRLSSISTKGTYMVYYHGVKEESRIRNMVTGEEINMGGRLWLSDELLLQNQGTADTFHNSRQYWILDMSDGSRTLLQSVQQMPGMITQQKNGPPIFSPKILEFFRTAQQVYFSPDIMSHLNFAVALATDFKNHPEENYILSTSINHGSEDAKAIRAFILENEIFYTDVRANYCHYSRSSPPSPENYPLPSPNNRFLANGTKIMDISGQVLVETTGSDCIKGWAHDSSGVYFQTSGGSALPLDPSWATGILKLNIPPEYLTQN